MDDDQLVAAERFRYPGDNVLVLGHRGPAELDDDEIARCREDLRARTRIQGASGSLSLASGSPNTTLKAWTAWPAAPFTRLSSTRARGPGRSVRRCGRKSGQVAAGDVFSPRWIGDHLHERLGRIGGSVQLIELRLGDRPRWTPWHAERFRRSSGSGGAGSQPARSAPTGKSELLLDLRAVAMTGDAIGADAFIDFREQHLRLGIPPRTGNSALGVDDDIIQRGRRGPAARARAARQSSSSPGSPRCERLRRATPVEVRAMQLRQPVHRGPRKQLGMGMLEAVPARVVGGVAKAEVGTEIDDRHSPFSDLGASEAAAPCGRARKTESMSVGSTSSLITASTAERCGWLVARGSSCRSRPDETAQLDKRMTREQSDQLPAGVAGGTHNRDTNRARRVQFTALG